MRVHAHALVRVLVWSRMYVSRCPGYGRPDSPPFSVSPCRGLRRTRRKLEGTVRTLGNLPNELRDWKRKGLGACTRLEGALARKAAAAASANALSGVAPGQNKKLSLTAR